MYSIIFRLTAVALQVLSEAREGVSDLYLNFQVPAETINQAALWLTKQQDKTTGAFRETNYEYNRRFQVGHLIMLTDEQINVCSNSALITINHIEWTHGGR